MRPLVVTIAALAIALAGGPMAAASPWDDAQRVPRAQIVAALRHEQAQGYRIEAIANSVRLQCNVLLALTDQARAADPLQRPLRIDHRDYFSAFLEVTGLAPRDAPSFAQAPHRAKEDYLVDYRLDQVLDPAESPDLPRRALNVKAGWPAAADAPESYSYEDRSTDPAIETRRQQVTSWRILDYGEAFVYDDLRGVSGRATSGLLGAIFSVIGHAQARQTRFAIAPDGLQVSRTTARKGLTLTQTITIRPDGSVLTGLPPERPDLAAIDRRLAGLPLRVAYRPMDRSPLPPSVP
jgi:hypothetical protein